MMRYCQIGLIATAGAALLFAGCRDNSTQSSQPVPPAVSAAATPEKTPISPPPSAPVKTPPQSVPVAVAEKPPAPPETVKVPPEIKAITWRTDFEAARQEGRQAGKDLLLFFHTEWCGYCRIMLEQTFPDPEVISLITQKFIPVKLDGEKEVELSRRYYISGYPTTVIVDSQGKERTRIAGYLPSQDYLKALAALSSAK